MIYPEAPTLQTPCGINPELWGQYLVKMTIPPVWSYRPQISEQLCPCCMPGPHIQSGHLCSASETGVPSPLFLPLLVLSFSISTLNASLEGNQILSLSQYKISHGPPFGDKITQLLGRRCKTTTLCHQTPHLSWNSPCSRSHAALLGSKQPPALLFAFSSHSSLCDDECVPDNSDKLSTVTALKDV